MLMQGGNAVDAAVAAAAVLNVVEPMNVGIGGDLFAIIYIAKEHKIYVLNASGMAPTGATVERFNKLGYRMESEKLGAGVGHAGRRNLAGHGARRGVGLASGAQALRQKDLQGGTGACGRIRARRFSGVRAHRT